MLVSTHFLPHGTQIIPGTEVVYNEDFRSLHQTMENIHVEGEVIILITPHGLADDDCFLLYNHDKFQGLYHEIDPAQSVLFGPLKFSRFWNGDLDLVDALFQHLGRFKVRKLTQGVPIYPMALAWGEAVPLNYIASGRRILILSIPRRRLNHVFDMKSELKLLGKHLLEFCNDHEERISLVFSGDLAHTHIHEGPYGFSETAGVFDRKVKQWMEDPHDSVLDELLELNKAALACGMPGICMLQGIFDELPHDLYTAFYSCPSYFGMIVASFTRK